MGKIYSNAFSRKAGAFGFGAGNNLSQYLYKLLDKSVPLTKEEQLEIAKKLPEQWAREKLVNCNLRFVFRMITSQEFAGLKLDMEDRFMSAVEGFLIGLDKWKADYNCGILSYCVWWMRATMQNRSRDTPTIRIPENVDVIRNTRNYLRNSGLTDDEIVQGGHLTWDGMERIKHVESLRVHSLDAETTHHQANEIGYGTFCDVIADENAPDPASEAQKGYERKVVSSAIAALTEDERRHVKLRYEDELTYKQIGMAFGCSHEQARIVDYRIRKKLSKFPELKRLFTSTKEWGDWWG